MIYTHIEELLSYALTNKLIDKEDTIWARNALLEILRLPDNHNAPPYRGPAQKDPSGILADISFYAAENNMLPVFPAFLLFPRIQNQGANDETEDLHNQNILNTSANFHIYQTRGVR